MAILPTNKPIKPIDWASPAEVEQLARSIVRNGVSLAIVKYPDRAGLNIIHEANIGRLPPEVEVLAVVRK